MYKRLILKYFNFYLKIDDYNYTIKYFQNLWMVLLDNINKKVVNKYKDKRGKISVQL